MRVFLVASYLGAGCAPGGLVSEGPPVAVDELCGEIAQIVCDADAACCGGASAAGCVAVQTDRCDETLGSLVADPRVAYAPTRGGFLLERLGVRAADCWEEPFLLAELTALFAGTGTEGADCTPSLVSGTMSARELLRAELSCAGGATCRVHLDAHEQPRGVHADSCSVSASPLRRGRARAQRRLVTSSHCPG